MSWEHFVYFAVASVLLWIWGAWAAWKDNKKQTYYTTIAGLLIFFSFIVMMWISLERPMAIQMDIVVLDPHGSRVYLHQHLQT